MISTRRPSGRFCNADRFYAAARRPGTKSGSPNRLRQRISAIQPNLTYEVSDSRTPDIIVAPNVGVICTGGAKKIGEDGGVAHDDTRASLEASRPFHPVTPDTADNFN